MLQDLHDLYSKILNKVIAGRYITYRDVVADGHHCRGGLIVAGSRRYCKESSLEGGSHCCRGSSLQGFVVVGGVSLL
jgi:hypothetical protein